MHNFNIFMKVLPSLLGLKPFQQHDAVLWTNLKSTLGYQVDMKIQNGTVMFFGG